MLFAVRLSKRLVISRVLILRVCARGRKTQRSRPGEAKPPSGLRVVNFWLHPTDPIDIMVIAPEAGGNVGFCLSNRILNTPRTVIS
jgi:hypothetical protein